MPSLPDLRSADDLLAFLRDDLDWPLPEDALLDDLTFDWSDGDLRLGEKAAHGALQAANVLKSDRAVAMSVYVVRAFIQQRELLMAQSDILKKLAQMDAKLLQHDSDLRIIWRELQPLLSPPPAPPKPRIGFKS